MLKIVVLGDEHFNEETQEFITVDDTVLELEHSLVSLSKWESEHEIPFLGKDEKTPEQMLSYVRHMDLGEERPLDFYTTLSQQNMSEIAKYIDRKMTATWFKDPPGGKKGNTSGELVTSELIYYWMIALQIPFECQHWHLKRLLTLIQVCNIKNQPAKKMNKRDAMAQQRSLNAARKAQMGSTG